MSLLSKLNPQFGGDVTDELKKRYASSKHWDGEKFNNLAETSIDISIWNMPKLLIGQFTDTKTRSPQTPIPVLPFDAEKFAANPEQPKFIWYGHSVLLLQLAGKNILIDPMLGPNASPIAPFSTKRFSENTLEIIDTLPPIDAVLMTHDHYDHLDLDSFKKLMPKVDTYIVALGVARHLEFWGIPASQITEMDWWQETQLGEIQLTFTPSRHFSGRGISDRAKTLWGGWVFKTSKNNLYWSGDGGYGTHFKEVGEKLGPFDWAFMECGQYNDLWSLIHMSPEEAVQAALDVGAKMSTAVHWGGFSLAMHHWKDPIERFVAEAKRLELPYCTPQIGEVIEMGKESETVDWFRGLV